MNFRRTRAMARKELLHIVRDPQSLMAALTQPLLVLLLFGYALSLDVDRIPTIIYDANRTVESRNLVLAFRGSRYFQVIDEVDSYRPIEKAMDQRRILVGVAIPADYSRDLLQGKVSPVQILLDGADSNTASIAMNFLLIAIVTCDILSLVIMRFVIAITGNIRVGLLSMSACLRVSCPTVWCNK